MYTEECPLRPCAAPLLLLRLCAGPENEMAIVDTEQKSGSPYSDGYHIVGADWEQDAIRMTLDGKRTKEFTR